jgi:endonuclease/exonuclease/phosphatase family metal-dependent hydrolase
VGATLKVMSLNLAHGRKDAWHQALLRRARIRANLDEIVQALHAERPDVVAFQEADASSIWSGRFDHVAYLACEAAMPYFVHGTHVKKMKLAYGTALASRHLLEDPSSHRFRPSPPTGAKGMVVGTIHLPSRPELPIHVISVHLDFSRKTIRQRQAREIVHQLSGRHGPMVLMGDFNCDLRGRETTLQILVRELHLKVHAPHSEHLATFAFRGRRLDWILISRELEFVDYRTLPETLSDHQAVVATLRLARKHAVVG